MSKSLGNVVDPFRAMEESSVNEGVGVDADEGGGVGVDGVRWYLARVGGRFRDDVGAHT
jgi:methionyl-tRNA synthetase